MLQRVLLLVCNRRSLECRHTGCSSASEFDSTDAKQFANAVNGPSIASVLTSASNSLPQIDYAADDSVYRVSSPCESTNSALTAQETVLNRSNAFRMVPPSTNGILPTTTQSADITYRSTASCQLCRNLREKTTTVRLLPTVAEQTVWMPSGVDNSSRLTEHGPVSADHRLIDNSTQLSNLSLDVSGGRTNSLSDQSSSSPSSEVYDSIAVCYNTVYCIAGFIMLFCYTM